jgi:peptide deformylase
MHILIHPDPFLHKKAEPVTVFDESLEKLFDEMEDCARKNNGIGLAAPQVGVSKRMFVVIMGKESLRIANPEIVESSGSETMAEGCLSLPGQEVVVTRPEWVVIEGRDKMGRPIAFKAFSILARVICHENDHLDGKLMIDYLQKEMLHPEKML